MHIERDWPRAHLVIDDFFEARALDAIFAELSSLEGRMKPGLVRDIGHDGQSLFLAHRRRRNRAVWVHDPSRTLRLFREHLWSEAMVQAFDGAREPLFQIIPSCWAPHLQVSTYMTGDHYDWHEDEGAGVNLTAIVFLAAHPEKVRGGDLVLAYDGSEASVRFRHNRLVIFPSKTPHRVTRVQVRSADTRDARISLQCWLTYGRPPAKPKRRPPQADRPTFLLAEESIIAAAQAMVPSATRDQTPEDLYWGAFYLTRILSSNLRSLLARLDVRIRSRPDLEVYGRGRLGGAALRVGFLLHAPDAARGQALSLFVEIGRGPEKSSFRRPVPREAGERKTLGVLRRLLARAAATTSPSRPVVSSER